MNSKTKIPALTTAVCCLFLCQPLNAQTVELELNKTLSPSDTLPYDISDSSIYTLDGEAYTGSIDENTNITVDYDLIAESADYSSYTLAMVNKSFTAGDFTYNMTLPQNFWVKQMLEIAWGQTMSVKNMTLHTLDSLTGHPKLIISLNQNATLDVREDFEFIDTRSSNAWYQTRLTIYGGGNINVAGDFTIKSEIPDPAPQDMPVGIDFTVETANFNVGGVLTLENNVAAHDNVFRTTSSSGGTFYRTIGGLQVSANGMIQLAGNAEANTTELSFTNSGVSEYVGGLLSREVDGQIVANKLNVRMNASDAANGRQIMRFTTTNGWKLDADTYADSASALGEVEVSSGRLDIGMYDGMKGGVLYLSAYSGRDSDAVFSATGNDSGNEIGKVVFDKMSFYHGTIAVDAIETASDFIQINGALTKSSDTSSLTFDISISAYDLQQWLLAAGAEEWDLELLSFATSGSNVSEGDFILALEDGVSGEIFIKELDGVSTIVASLTATVPEPAEIASLFGLFTLFAAALRRKK